MNRSSRSVSLTVFCYRIDWIQKADNNIMLCPLEARIYAGRHKIVTETIESFKTSQISSCVIWSQRDLSMTLRLFDALSCLVCTASKNNVF